MTQDKKQSRRKKMVEAVTTEPKSLQLTEVEVLKLRLFMTERDRFKQQKMLTNIKRLSYLKQVDPNDLLAKFDGELSALDAAVVQAEKQYQEVVEAVQSRLNLKLDEYTFDGQTGILRSVQ